METRFFLLAWLVLLGLGCAFLKNVDLINNRLVIVFSSFKFSKKLLFMLLIFFFFLS